MPLTPEIIMVFVFVFGTCIGSFLNVVIFRLPENRSIVYPGSHCPACSTPLPFYHNIPILSWAVLHGRCGFCRAPISVRYPVVELMSGIIFILIFLKFGISLQTGFWMAFASVLLTVSFIDFDHQIIPDILSIPGILIFASSACFVPDMTVLKVIFGILTGGGILLSVAYGYYFLKGTAGMGGGDIKLLAMIGAAVGVEGVLFTLFAGSFLGTLAGMALMAVNRKKDFKLKIAFGPFLSAGALIYVLWGNRIIYWYWTILSGI